MPFFAPFYIPGKEVHIHSPVESEALEQCLRDQWRHPYFPITFDQLLGKIHFHHFKRSTQIGDFNIKAVDLVHPNPTYGFRVEQGGTSYVHFSDVELRELSKAKLKQYRAIMKDADFVVGDTQFDLDEIETFKTWGHSCAETFLELFGDCGIKTFAMFHYNPQESEAKIDQLLRSAKKKAKTTPSQTKVIPAIEGQVIQL
jgi:ribonuclease BN (tRNA processing enzyme)